MTLVAQGLNTRTYQNIWCFQTGYHALYVEIVNTCEIYGFRCGAVKVFALWVVAR